MPILYESRRKKIQRFLVLSSLSLPVFWFPIIKSIVEKEFKLLKRLIFVLDRTQWKDNNIFMISVIWRKRALPIYWLILEKKGSSNIREQIALIRPVLKFLILLIAIAYTSACLKGKSFKNQGHQKYIARLTEAKRESRRHSDFRVGLYGYNWVIAWDFCCSTVEKLMEINRHKLNYYQQGLKVLSAIS